jgi:GNAT superfamily N-acetyltransferase
VSFIWRTAAAADDQAVVSLSLALSAEDPGQVPLSPEQVRRTLARLREEPARGRAVVCEADGEIAGYCLMISFWSNELGGEVCVVDELFVAPRYRSRGLATDLLQRLVDGDASLWPSKPAALALEVSFDNHRARALYERLGFQGKNLAMRRLLSV